MDRKDTQVKVRGQRVELGEVEYNLNRCVGPSTETVAGLLSNNKLAAFIRITNKEDASQLLKELESQLSSVLPRYMIPSVFYTIPDIPRTASGKLDRRQLKVWVDDDFLGKPVSFPNGLKGELGRSLSENETVLARCWNWVLELGAISPTHADNFFRRGGDSVDAIQLVDTLRGEGVS
jgi:AMP-binding enzyme C-terminal domain